LYSHRILTYCVIMAIEIKELHIRVNVTSNTSEHERSTSQPALLEQSKNSAVWKQEFITECVEEVMKILENKKER
jgi:hypothetical protein